MNTKVSVCINEALARGNFCLRVIANTCLHKSSLYNLKPYTRTRRIGLALFTVILSICVFWSFQLATAIEGSMKWMEIARAHTLIWSHRRQHTEWRFRWSPRHVKKTECHVTLSPYYWITQTNTRRKASLEYLYSTPSIFTEELQPPFNFINRFVTFTTRSYRVLKFFKTTWDSMYFDRDALLIWF